MATKDATELKNLKGLEYITTQPESHPCNGDASPVASTAFVTPCYPDLTSQASLRHRSADSDAALVTMDTALDSYTVEKRRPCSPSRQTTVHVVVMALAGIAYLGIGGIAGYYIHKAYGSDDDPVTGASAGGWNPGPGGWNPTSSPGAPGPSPATSPEAPTTTTEAIMPTTAVQPPTPAERNYCVQEGPLCRCGPVGGDGGQGVSHRDQWISHGNVSGFTVQHNDYLVGWLQFQYGADPIVSGSKLGYTDTMYQVQVTMGKDEFITEVSLDFTSTKVFLTRLLVSTNLRKFGPFGGRGAQNYTVKGSKLMYIEGQSGALVDQITAFFDKCS